MVFKKEHKPWNKNKKLGPRSKEVKKLLSIKNKGNIPWNKGLTKEIDKRLKSTSNKLKERVVSKKTREKLSKANKGKNNPNYGKPRSEETKKKISENNKGKHNHSEKIRKRISTAHKGKKLSEETKKRMSEARKGKNNPLYGKHLSEEVKKKISNTMKGKHNAFGYRHSAKTKKRISNIMKGKHHSEVTKQKIRESMILRIQNYSGHYKNTKPELKMKDILNFLNIPFKHQFRLGNHLFDFHILNTNILIEVDGDYYHGNPKKFSKLNKIQIENKQRDIKHNKIAKTNNFILLRFWQDDILHNEKIVIEELRRFLNGS